MKIPDEIVREAWDAYCDTEGTRTIGDRSKIRAAGAVFARWAMEEAAKVILTQCHDDHTREEEAAAIRARKDEM